MGRAKTNSTVRKTTSTPIEIFKHCIGWNSSNIPRVTKDGYILYSYRNRFILNKNDNCLDMAVKEGYMLKSNYCDKFNQYTLTDKGFKYIEEHENISIVRNVDLHKLHEEYAKSIGEDNTKKTISSSKKPTKQKSTKNAVKAQANTSSPVKKRGRKKKNAE